MQLSTRGRYAVMAMVDLASRGDCGGRPVPLAEIAGAQLLSLAYLEQLFGHLRRAGLVCSTRGPGGGYRLARAPAEICIAEIICAVDEKLCATRCHDGVGCLVHADGLATTCLTHDLWAALGQQMQQFLSGVSLADVLEGRLAAADAAAPDAPLGTAEPTHAA